jgi:serine/threonine protein kinase
MATVGVRPSRVLPSSLIALRYSIQDILGRGGMATVYRARHLGLDRDVALKVLPPPPAGTSARDLARFEREARTAARLDHPGCVRVVDFGACADGTRYLAMELVDGPTLRAGIRAGVHCRAETAAWIGSELCDALAHAHGQGVIHRDVKPENVMFARTATGWRVVLIDFGLSRLAGDPALTANGALVGSPSYIAPERVAGGRADARSDVYAVGVILYELVTGRRPFVAPTPAATARLHLTEDPIPVEERAPALPPAMAALIRAAMARDPDQRFPDAASLGTSLRRFADLRHRTPPPSSPQRASAEVDGAVMSAETTWIRLPRAVTADSAAC